MQKQHPHVTLRTHAQQTRAMYLDSLPLSSERSPQPALRGGRSVQVSSSVQTTATRGKQARREHGVHIQHASYGS
jgi:hypothetical protein